MPDGLEVGSFLWSVICFPESEIEVDKTSQLQLARILALPKTPLEGTISMVA
jgi:hypothetical protein